VNYSRQSKLLDPSQLKGKSVSIIGVGATGSHVAMVLAQMGFGWESMGQGTMKLFDGDKVEEHNISNQIFGLSDIGEFKVNAMSNSISRKCGFSVMNFPIMVDGMNRDVPSTYVMILTDTMESRKKIFDECVQYQFNVDLVIETRMGLRDGRVYAFNPHNSDHVDKWKETLYKDEEAETSLCGASSSIASTAIVVAGFAVSRIVQHFNSKYGLDNLKGKDGIERPIWNELIFSLYPESFYVRSFESNKSQIFQ